MEYSIEKFETKHLILRESFFETLQNLSDTLVLDQEKTQELLDKIQAQWSSIFLAISPQHGVIGTITLLLEQKMIKWWAIAGHIEDVATRAWFTGHGVAKQLIETAIQEAKQNWCYKIILDCDERLVPFYEKYWFKKEGNFMRHYLI